MPVNAYKIISRKIENSYISFKIEAKSKKITINFTPHVIERAKLWRLKESEIIDALLFPDEVVTGHGKRFIAHKVRGSSVIRVIYDYRDKTIFVITVYVPSKERYFQGGNNYADKILP